MIRSEALRVIEASPVLARARGEQAQLTAVERFARRHDAGEVSGRRYAERLPARGPGPGEQYAFEVDLDACTGCKACVAGCHNLNGLDPDEVWRTVGALVGGSAAQPVLRTVTTSCHHCLEPACLAGCPVEAYEKDPATGVVRHLDDQCIGCQYCILMCPYDAPKYNPARGIVRKCDLCVTRLQAGEAPACVQACPNGAIRVTVVSERDVVSAAEAGSFLPSAPEPATTLPTTVYRSKAPLPANLLGADFYATRPEDGHGALVVMLVLTQLAAGAFALAALTRPLGGAAWTRASGLFALGVAVAALGASLFHLGRPHLAFRAVLGLRTSWLSREILCFGLFAGLAALEALRLGGGGMGRLLAPAAGWLGPAGAVAGLAGVFTSVMVYAATRRPVWAASITGPRFFLSALALGAAALGTLALLLGLDEGGAARTLYRVVALAAGLKLAGEALLLSRRHDRAQTPFKRSARVALGQLRSLTTARFFAGAFGGLLVPLLFAAGALAGEPRGLVGLVAVTGLVALLAGELCERSLFFRAAPGSRMPGGPA